MRIVLTLRYSQGLSWQQIAQNMGVFGDGAQSEKNTTDF